MVRLVVFLACFFGGYVGVPKERRELNWSLEVVHRSSFDSGEAMQLRECHTRDESALNSVS